MFTAFAFIVSALKSSDDFTRLLGKVFAVFIIVIIIVVVIFTFISISENMVNFILEN